MKQQIIVLNSMAIEVTRRCNMACAHCLRGESCSKDMSEAIIPCLFDGIDTIGHLTFSGGEPTLNVPFIRKCVDYILEHDIVVNGCFIAVNGMIYSQELVDCVRDLCLRKVEREYGKESYVAFDSLRTQGDYTMSYGSAEQDFELFLYDFAIKVSQDEFHAAIPFAEWLKWRSCGFYMADSFPAEKSVIARGNAEALPVSKTFYKPIAEEPDYELDENTIIWNSILYINCDGNVYHDCDMSYDDMCDSIPFANILSFENIMDEDGCPQTSIREAIIKQVERDNAAMKG